MEIGKIDIAGITYTFYLYRNFKDINQKAINRDERYVINSETKVDRKPIDGYCDYSAKEINVYTDEYTNKDYFEATIRHEIIHALLYEIGFPNHDDEELIDRLSRWVPCINKSMTEALNKLEDKKVVGSSRDSD